ncbi:MAG: BamA/TamA family outer membrane protein [Ignavibacteriaceae bacterium]|nr:BamA/TamA family outer membrane protein [Ignavibacteriaceae bacterium]
MMHTSIKIFLISLACFSSILFAQSTEIIEIETVKRALPFGLSENISLANPVVALALSGGGARGFAQIGVLKAFEEAKIPINIIIGTSMGSIVGGLYSAGYSVHELDSLAKNLDWNSFVALDRKTNRRDLFVDQKITEDKAVLNLRLQGLKPIIPTSINDGQLLTNKLNLLALHAPIHAANGFNNLLYKFRAVCTDLVSGELVLLGEGSLGLALRASSSVSFLLSPTKLDSLLLVDGGLVANVPVKPAIEQGANFVIAVNTTSDLHSERELIYPWIVADQVVSIPMKLLNQSQLSLADFIVQPKLDNIISNDFSNIDSIINLGYTCAASQMKILKDKLDSLQQVNLKTNNKTFNKPKIVSNSVPEVHDYLTKDFHNPDSISSAGIKKMLNNIFQSGEYKNLKAEINFENDSTTIEILGEKKPLIKSVLVSGTAAIEKRVVEECLKSLINKPYVERNVVAVIVDILKLYRKKGFSLAEVRNVSYDNNTSQLNLDIDEGKIFRIEIDGNERTSQTIITREFPIKEGENFLYQNIEEGLRNLKSTNLFDNIIFNVKRENDGNVIVLQVSERESGVVRFGFRADNENKTQASLDVRDENLFGSGTEIGALIYGGARNRGLILEHKANRLWNTYLTYKINAYYQIDDVFLYGDDLANSEYRFSRSALGEYRQIYYGASVSVGTQVEKFGNLIFKGKYQVDQIKNKTNEIISPYKAEIVSLKISTTIDTQDKYPFPKNGFLFNGFYETAQTVLGGDIGFTNFSFDYKSYFSFAHDHTLAPRFSLGFGDKTLPLSQHYSLGGLYSFFGMREDEFRGRQLFLASLEYRYNLPVDLFFDTYFMLRYDLGSIWDVQEAIRFKDLRHGIGAALSLDTPIGPADFAVGRSFLFKKNLPGNPISWGDIMFYFSIGYYF